MQPDMLSHEDIGEALGGEARLGRGRPVCPFGERVDYGDDAVEAIYAFGQLGNEVNVDATPSLRRDIQWLEQAVVAVG